MVPSATTSTVQPWWVQVEENAETAPASGRVTTTPCASRIRPPPTGTSATGTSAAPPAEDVDPYAFAAAPAGRAGQRNSGSGEEPQRGREPGEDEHRQHRPAEHEQRPSRQVTGPKSEHLRGVGPVEGAARYAVDDDQRATGLEPEGPDAVERHRELRAKARLPLHRWTNATLAGTGRTTGSRSQIPNAVTSCTTINASTMLDSHAFICSTPEKPRVSSG